jgi:DNA-binding CsgD family transcriptional regulator
MSLRTHIATTTDGVQLAWARSGRGPTLVKASNWMTHLRDDVDSPVWGHWTRFLSAHFDFVRFDEARPEGEAPLTSQERRLLDLLRQGKTNAQIAAEAFISEKTVRNHLSSVYRKLGVANRAQAIVRAGAKA